MKSKLDVTIFHNGDVDVLHGSIYQELWKDYETFKKRALWLQEKGTVKGDFLARRYERAALQSLYVFFAGVVDMWVMQIVQHHPEYTGITNGIMQEKIDCIREYVVRCAHREIAYDREKLSLYISRYEHHDLSFIEYVTYDVLCDVEEKINAFLDGVENVTELKRFPEPDTSTTELVNSLGELVRNVSL